MYLELWLIVPAGPITETGDYTPEEDDASQIKTSVEKVKEGHKSDEEKKDEKEESSPPKMKVLLLMKNPPCSTFSCYDCLFAMKSKC